MNEHRPAAPLEHRLAPEIHRACDYETLATRFIAQPTYEYIAGGSGDDRTLAANRAAFEELSICPRLLHDVTGGSTRVQLAGRELLHPVLLAPLALQTLVHPAGEIETARAAAATDTCMVSSTLSSFTLEEIAGAAGPDKWFQLYFQSQPEVTLDLVQRAESAGFTGIVVTLDASIQLPSSRALRAGFRMPAHCSPANLSRYSQTPPSTPAPGESRIFRGAMRHAPTWRDLDRLIARARVPVWVKGVLHPDDALALRDRGVSGVIVSNHGGRTLDGAPASLRALPAVRAAVGEAFPVLLDSGIRSGSDIFKALASGADAALIGRLQAYALGAAGALGVAHMIKLLREELEVCMAMAGCATLQEIRHAAVRPLAA